ncbi:MAG TPA: hypothetical protein VN673_16795 [Clostridia bacterium]|nr:hypothetical protein [Clostridia bacterium]
MKSAILAGIATLALLSAQAGGPPEKTTPMRRSSAPPPPVYRDTSLPPRSTAPVQPPQGAPVNTYEQSPISSRQVMVTPEQARKIIQRFKAAYPKLGKPRMLIYVNRDLVDDQSGMKLSQRTERMETTRSKGTTNAGESSTSRSVNQNTYRPAEKPKVTLADKQTVRDLERLFGRPLRNAGASLADQRVATQIMADRSLEEFVGSADTPQARKDRAALAQIADVVIEVLVSSRDVVVPTVSGEQTFALPDIQATAIRLSDSKVMGQASSSDVTTRVPPASLRNIDVREITEATALTLMEDMLQQ